MYSNEWDLKISENDELYQDPKGIVRTILVPLRDEAKRDARVNLASRNCAMARIARFMKRVPARDGEYAAARDSQGIGSFRVCDTVFPYSVHFGARGSRRRDGDVHGLACSLSQQVTESRPTGFKERREISDEEYGQR